MIPAIPHISVPRSSRQDVQVLLALPVRDGGEELLPLVTLVVHVDIVEASWHRTAHDLVGLECLERLPQMRRDARDLTALVQHVVDVPLLGRARVELALDSVEPALEERRLREVGVAGRVDRAELEATAARDADERRAVLPAVVLVDRRPEAEVPEALVGVDGRGGDAAEAPI